MRKSKFIAVFALILCLVFAFAACSDLGGEFRQNPSDKYNPAPGVNEQTDEDNGQTDGGQYIPIVDNPDVDTSENALSSFSVDHSTAYYANLRRLINTKYSVIKPDAVRVEDMLNYFKYDYAQPGEDDVFAFNTEIVPAPWNEDNYVASIAFTTAEAALDGLPASNLVFLIDISGSMGSPSKLSLVKEALLYFIENGPMREQDTMSIVTYSNVIKVPVKGAPAGSTGLKNAVEALYASGATAGGAGLQKAYEVARELYVEGGNNRVMLITDNDFNIGISSEQELAEFIAGQRVKDGKPVYLSVLGVGTESVAVFSKMETLARHGNGNFSFLDRQEEARRVLIEEYGSVVYTVAKDVKTQVEFNPAYIKTFRLLGYETKLLTDEEFDDSKTDAGEIGPGYAVTALYEIQFHEGELPSTMGENFFKVTLRYKDPESNEDREVLWFAGEEHMSDECTSDMLFKLSVAETALVLRNSKHKGTASLQRALSRINTLPSVQEDYYKQEFANLIATLIERG